MPEKITDVAVGVLLRPDGTVLLGNRPANKPWPGWWELPGGKVAEGETEREALARELLEELGVEVTVGDRIGDDVPIGDGIILRAYRVSQTAGTLHPHDHGALRWVRAGDLPDLPWVPADRAWLPALLALLAG